jgi:hypothetical protein
MFRKLDPEKIIWTLERLHQRIEERFAGAGLSRVCHELQAIAEQAHARSLEIARPNLWLRGGAVVVIALGFAMIGAVGWRLLAATKTSDDLFSTLQGIDAGFNIIVLMGAALYFMFSLEERWKRRRALSALHELRSIVHVIDMHQLTKDPSAEVTISVPTPSSPVRTLSHYETGRYLDYCSEMLSLSAKVAVLYAQSFPDPVVTEAVNDLERTSSSLSQKIWQKINILERAMSPSAADGTTAAVPASPGIWAAAVPPGAGPSPPTPRRTGPSPD